MKISHVLTLVGVALLSGCYSMPTRDYVSNPYTLPASPQTTQPDFEPFGSFGDQYQTILVNTPSGMVYKRCKVLNGQAVACF